MHATLAAVTLIFAGLLGGSLEATPPTNDSVDIDTSIVGGLRAREGQFPYQVLLRHQSRPICSGSIVTPRYVLTSGHCVIATGRRTIHPAHLTMRAGTTNANAGGTILRVAQVKLHPQYGPNINDVALLRLVQPIRCSRNICVIRVARNPIRTGTRMTLSGWGRQRTGGTMQQDLRYVQATAMSSNQCSTHPSVFCVSSPRGRGICQGDSGGPAVAAGLLFGVISFTMGSCGSDRPDGVSRLSHLYTWLEQNSR